MTTLDSIGPIAVAAGHCARFFEDILSGKSIDPQIEQQSDRFRLWAGNIGARQVGKSSLDYRLREASDVADMLSQLLDALQTQLAQWRSTQGNSLLSNRIRETVDDLYALLLIIRQPPPLDRYTKSEDVDLSYFQEFDARHVLEKYPLLHSRAWLVARLADANVRRRQFLKYRELHNQKLSRAHDAPDTGQNGIIETEMTSPSPKALVAAKTAATSHSEAKESSKTPTLADTVATPFFPKVETRVGEDSDEARSATTFATSVGGPHRITLRIPSRPSASLDGQIFICPLCYFPEQVKSDDGWKRHVLHDLQPYTCTFEYCPSALFTSRHAWFEHELGAHRKEWTCGICRVGTKSPSAFVEHAQRIHQRAFPDRLLSKILQQNERPQARYKTNECPFCDDWTVSHVDGDVHQDEIYVTVKQFRQHVGRHMEDLALFVLPVDLDDEFQSQKAAGEAESFDSSGSIVDVTKIDDPNEPVASVIEQPHEACRQGDLEEVEKLIRGGVDVNLELSDGSTPLMKAVETRSIGVAKLLLNAGAKVDHINKYHETALSHAVSQGDIDLFALLLKFGADVNRKQENGRTLLMNACIFNNDSQMLEMLVRGGADISAKDDHGRTALLHYFSTVIDLRTDWETALDVLSGPSVDIEAVDDTQDGFRVLHWIAWRGLREVCVRILQLGADIDAQNRVGNTPLEVAMMRQHREVALALLDMGADVGEVYPPDLHSELRPLLGWASSNDRLHVGKLVVHKHKMWQGRFGEGVLRRVSKVIRTDSPFVFEVEDLATNDASAAVQNTKTYRGYSTDFIPLRPEAGKNRDIISPGQRVLARYPGTRLLLPGIYLDLNFQSIIVDFPHDDQGTPRGIDARFVIPWNSRSSASSKKREPPLSFCFTIRNIQPDYPMQPHHFTMPPDPLWLPPTRTQAFRLDTTIGSYLWHNGLVLPISAAEQDYWVHYSTTSIFWSSDRQAFLHVPYDCTKVDVPLEQPWLNISFQYKEGPRNRLLSLAGYGYDFNDVCGATLPAWVPELLPGAYRYDDVEKGIGTAQLAGSLSLLLGLAAFSGPRDKMLETIRKSFRAQGSDWTPHGRVGMGRINERGLVVDIGYDSRMGWDEQYLQSWEEGEYGPIIS